jgi:UDP-glucuronate 4-epimerase
VSERILVTGAAGFIGSHACEALVGAGRAVLGLDNFDPYYDEATKRASLHRLAASPGFTFVAGDVRDPGILRNAASACDAVIHCAARPGVRESWGKAALYHDINVRGTAAVVAGCREAGIRRMVLVSSSSVYGDGAPPFLEDAALAPISPYAESKAAAEDVCRVFGQNEGSVAIVRLFSVYGPRLRPDLALHRFVRSLVAGQAVPRFGDGSSARDYTHVDDAVRGLVAALEWTAHGRPRCEAFNVGSGRPVMLDALIAALAGVLGRPARIQALPDQRGDARCTWADLAKASRSLGYQPRVGLMDGLQSLRRWYEESHGTTP